MKMKLELYKQALETVEDMLYDDGVYPDDETMEMIKENIKEFIIVDGIKDINKIIEYLNLEDLY